MPLLQTDGLRPVGDTSLYVATTGTGPPVLVMHGGLGVDHTYFRPWLDELGDVAEVVYYDHRGNGRSPGPLGPEVDHSTWVGDADALREKLGHEQVVILGHSYGGFLALEYAIAHPERVRGLVLVSSAATVQHWDRVHANLAARDATPEQLRAFEVAEFEDDADMAATFGALLPLYFHRPDDAVIAAMGASTHYSVEGSRACGRNIGSYDVRDRLGELAVPALVLGGRHDFIMPPDVTSEPLAASLPQAELVVFEDSGHFPFIEEPQAFSRTVRTWLAGLPA